jgi:NH3-dependent NAD+ synthetase
MITDDFDERTVANMEVALERACQRFPRELAHHEARKYIAAKLLERARHGERTLTGFTHAAMAAAVIITSKERQKPSRSRAEKGQQPSAPLPAIISDQ